MARVIHGVISVRWYVRDHLCLIEMTTSLMSTFFLLLFFFSIKMKLFVRKLIDQFQLNYTVLLFIITSLGIISINCKDHFRLKLCVKQHQFKKVFLETPQTSKNKQKKVQKPTNMKLKLFKNRIEMKILLPKKWKIGLRLRCCMKKKETRKCEKKIRNKKNKQIQT